MKTQKFDSDEITNLIDRIKLNKKSNWDTTLSLKQINIIKFINPQFSETKYGEYNGYGYENLGKWLLAKNYDIVLKVLKKLLKNNVKVIKEKKEVTEEEKIEKWAKRLAKFTNISVDNAILIAEEKIEYKIDKLFDAVNYECSGWKIPSWQKKAERDYDKIAGAFGDRSKALDRIKDEEHAQAILIASKRHKESNYEAKLEEAKELVLSGELDKVDVQDWARKNISF